MTGSTTTIFAIATGEIAAALSVLRLSGPDAFALLDRLIDGPAPAARRASLRVLRDPRDGAAIDEALVLRFPGPNSFTGEDVVELHVHGGPAVRQALIVALAALGAEQAAPGAFSQRRYRAGLFDLSQAEGLAALIAAETEAQRRHSMRLMDGEFGRRVAAWRAALVDALALIEVGLDFAEEDIGQDVEDAATAQLRILATQLSDELAAAQRDTPGLATPTVAIIGPPNAGKSTLLNSLADAELAIVSDIPGTTRDTVRTRLTLGGRALEVVDSAGMRETTDPIEAIGVDRAQKLAAQADLRIIVLAIDAPWSPAALTDLRRDRDIIVWNKADLAPTPPDGMAGLEGYLPMAQGNLGHLSALLSEINQRFDDAAPALSLLAGSDRRRLQVEKAHNSVIEAEAALHHGRPELAVERLRQANRDLHLLVGHIDQEEIYTEIFSRFCIGK